MSDESSVPPPFVDLGFCRLCARAVTTASIRDDEHREFMITAVCSACQSLMYAGAHLDPPVSCPALYGNVLGVVSDGPSVWSAGVLPWRYDPWDGHFEWQVQHVLRAGSVSPYVDPTQELRAMRGDFDPADLRVLMLPSCDDPLLSARLARAHLLIVLHDGDEALAGSLLRPARLPPSVAPIPPPLVVALARKVPWADSFGAPLLPLPEFLRAQRLPELAESAATCEASALRKCALAARLLGLPVGPESDGSTVFEQWLLGCAPPASPSGGDSDEVL